jgi:hypothetical protein
VGDHNLDIHSVGIGVGAFESDIDDPQSGHLSSDKVEIRSSNKGRTQLSWKK